MMSVHVSRLRQKSTLNQSEATPLRQTAPLMYRLLVVTMMVAMVAAAMLFVLLIRIG